MVSSINHPRLPMSAALSKLEASIEAQRKKLAQLTARKQRIEAQQRAKLQGEERKKDTRRKILAGAMVLELMAQNDEAGRKVLARLDGFLKRSDDRALFGLDPLPDAGGAAGGAAVDLSALDVPDGQAVPRKN